jgi:hypothetical protein
LTKPWLRSNIGLPLEIMREENNCNQCRRPDEEAIMNNKLYLWLSLLVLLLTIVPVMTGCGLPAKSPATASAPGGVPQESITVHGHWTIEVINPDGTLANHREFENALMIGAQAGLTQILGRDYSVGGWDIALMNNSGTSPFIGSGGYSDFGAIVESSYPDSAPFIFKTLTISNNGIQNPAWLKLAGTATAQRDGSITSVVTGVTLLSPDQVPSGTYSSSGLGGSTGFTMSDINAVDMVAGQQIVVTVVISFS